MISAHTIVFDFDLTMSNIHMYSEFGRDHHDLKKEHACEMKDVTLQDYMKDPQSVVERLPETELTLAILKDINDGTIKPCTSTILCNWVTCEKLELLKYQPQKKRTRSEPLCPCGGGHSCIVTRRSFDDVVVEDNVFKSANVPLRKNCLTDFTFEQLKALDENRTSSPLTVDNRKGVLDNAFV